MGEAARDRGGGGGGERPASAFSSNRKSSAGTAHTQSRCSSALTTKSHASHVSHASTTTTDSTTFNPLLQHLHQQRLQSHSPTALPNHTVSPTHNTNLTPPPHRPNLSHALNLLLDISRSSTPRRTFGTPAGEYDVASAMATLEADRRKAACDEKGGDFRLYAEFIRRSGMPGSGAERPVLSGMSAMSCYSASCYTERSVNLVDALARDDVGDVKGDDRLQHQRGLRISCQFDARTQPEEDTKPGRPVMTSQVFPRAELMAQKKGPLATLYECYAKRDEVLLGGAQGRSVENVMQDVGSLMNMNELQALLVDFEVLPQLVRRRDVLRAFKAADSIPLKSDNINSGDSAVKSPKSNLGSPKSGKARPKTNNRPDELCYEEFLDAMVRIAVVAFGRKRHKDQYPTQEKQVTALMEKMSLDSRDTRPLRARLAAYQRLAMERGAQRKLRRWDYVSGALSPDEGGAGLGEALAGWQEGVPARLLATLTRHEGGEGREDELEEVQWYAFKARAIDVGAVGVGTPARRFRVSAVNPGPRTLAVLAVDIVDAPYLTANYKNRPMVPGMPFIIELEASFESSGEWLGSIDITVKSDKNSEPESYSLPVYARIVPRGALVKGHNQPSS